VCGKQEVWGKSSAAYFTRRMEALLWTVDGASDRSDALSLASPKLDSRAPTTYFQYGYVLLNFRKWCRFRDIT
jgi:hypothetical protein